MPRMKFQCSSISCTFPLLVLLLFGTWSHVHATDGSSEKPESNGADAQVSIIGQVRRAKYPVHPYGEEAVANLTRWRSSLFQRTMEWYSKVLATGGRRLLQSAADDASLLGFAPPAGSQAAASDSSILEPVLQPDAGSTTPAARLAQLQRYQAARRSGGRVRRATSQQRLGNSGCWNTDPIWLDSMELWMPFITCPPGMPVTNVKSSDPKDAGKWMCGVEHLKSLGSSCVIYSLGSRNEYDFEEFILSNTECIVHTFDCTVVGRSLGDRHKFYQQCIGDAPSGALNADQYLSLPAARKQLGHRHIHILKMDIEGYEYDALRGWSDFDVLPDQLLLEIHYGMPRRPGVKTVDTPAEMAVFMGHLANLGYGIMAKENNNYGHCCAELGLLRVETISPLKARVVDGKLDLGQEAGDHGHEAGGGEDQQHRHHHQLKLRLNGSSAR